MVKRMGRLSCGYILGCLGTCLGELEQSFRECRPTKTISTLKLFISIQGARTVQKLDAADSI